MPRKQFVPDNQTAFDFLSLQPVEKRIRKQRIMVEQLLFYFEQGLILTSIESLPYSRQKHGERLPTDNAGKPLAIRLVVPKVTPLDRQKKTVRAAIIEELKKHA